MIVQRRFGTNCLFRDKISSILFLIHNDPQLITRWAHASGTTVLRKMKEHCLSLEFSLKRLLPFKTT